MYFITAECDPAALTLANGTITLDRYYGGDNLLYSCDDGYTKTKDPVCIESGNWSHDPGCLLVEDGKVSASGSGTTESTRMQSQRGK